MQNFIFHFLKEKGEKVQEQIERVLILYEYAEQDLNLHDLSH